MSLSRIVASLGLTAAHNLPALNGILSGAASQVTALNTLKSAVAAKQDSSALSAFATTGSYTNLTGTPSAYSLPVASASVLGGVKQGTNITIDGTGVVSATQVVSSVFGRTGAVTLQSSDVTTALGFTPYNATNPSGYITGSYSLAGDLGGTPGANTVAKLDNVGLSITSPVSGNILVYNGTNFVNQAPTGGSSILKGYSVTTTVGLISASTNSTLVGYLPAGLAATQQVLPVSATWFAIAWNGSVFCAVAGGGTASSVGATSPDGITWTQRTLPSATWSSIAWNGSVFCAVAGDSALSTIAATSPDGITWTSRTLPASTYWDGIAWNGTVFCAVAGGSTIAATSPDGITWTQRVLPVSAPWTCIAWNGSVFCAVAGYGAASTIAATSPDGITWTQRAMPVSTYWSSIAWNGTVFCAISWGGGIANTIAATSPDGITWTQRVMPVSVIWNSIAWNGTVFCVVSGSTVAATSPDGIAWTQRIMPVSANWSAIASNGTGFCAVAQGTTIAATMNIDSTKLQVPPLVDAGIGNAISWT